ncbi:hypothetical protein F4553_000906 [Allocatelliglobosispora scoriae]|uniref:Uncharacterized protein n=1 Tax=Allocatelliglobosispora scoriae TaxID=643052 RepID=A0A841BEL3_9ACTN|nr:hypothetical protein [Allocatelliglobosispora scoriae]MBB5867527.1 hypothetical protein [Allocatelliglobosispora scoriae]
MTVSDYSFFADVAATGLILGIGRGSTMQEVEDSLGGDYLDDHGDGFIRRDYGLLEITFLDRNGWSCGFIIVEVHRLAGDRSLVPPAIEARYGPLPARLTAGPYFTALTKRGFGPERVADDSASDYLRYVIPATECVIDVVDDPQDVVGWPGFGEVWSLSLNPLSKSGMNAPR